ncbi:fatty-acid-binding protein 1 [Primulina eburnea]|uniref:fatty-acid-binding protein 1 n=1 Tax=Primulina eburnea TaxID=1245227 RepID=UPI003C6BF2E2
MVSFRFPFSFPQPPKPPISAAANASSRKFYSYAAVAALSFSAAGAGIAISQNTNSPFLQNALNLLASNFTHNGSMLNPLWGSLSLSLNSSPITESRTGMSFPAVLWDSQCLLGVGLRKKAVLGLKNIDVYAFGVYADHDDVKKFLSEKHGDFLVPKLNEELTEDLMESGVSMTVRLQIVYGRLSIRSVRSAFEESVGSRLQKFGGLDNKELLQRFTSQFKDDIKIPRGSIIDLSREQGHVLRTTIDGKDVGSIESELLCRSVLDLYIGKESFDKIAREDVARNLASLLGK